MQQAQMAEDLEVLPAYAGMIPSVQPRDSPSKRAPRVCGDDPDAGKRWRSYVECSPRMRG